MVNKKTILLFLVLMIFSCSQKNETSFNKSNLEEEIQLIAETISSCIGWFKNKDFDLLYRVVVNDSSFISVHPTDKVVKGFDEFEKNSEIFRNPDFNYVRHEINNLIINLSKSGDVAWFYCILNDINTFKGKPANWENTRWTGVLEKKEGKWVIMQQHFSFATK